MSKHAYLIIAHNKWGQLQFLIDILNDPRNDFFLLVDAKAKDFNQARFKKKCHSKNIYFVNSVKIYWGDYSQIEAEMSLIKAAISAGKYSYYHLMSAVDMPLVNQNEIHRFFDDNQGMEFVDFDYYDELDFAIERTGYYYFMQKFIGRRRKHPLKILRDIVIKLEKLCKVNRMKGFEQYLGKGANWFSITDNFARYIVDNEKFIKKHFKLTFCADEVFLQTMLKMSPFNKNWYGFKDSTIQYQNLRYTDWNRGKPYTFNLDDYFDLCQDSRYLFARKFSSDIVNDEVKKLMISKLK